MASSNWLRKAAHLLVGASLLLTAALPALDRDMVQTGARIETEHSRSACGYVHDHAICVQWAGSRWVASPAQSGEIQADVVDHPEAPVARFAVASTVTFRPRSRAPPA